MRAYGSLNNRVDENKVFTKDGLIHENDDITMYYWSDRTCYFITKVIDQKHIFVHKYEVVASRDEGNYTRGDQNWKYFKTNRECQEYLNTHIKNREQVDLNTVLESEDEEWVFRYGKWRQVLRKKFDYKLDTFIDLVKPEYVKIQPVSFGVRDYYYDYEF